MAKDGHEVWGAIVQVMFRSKATNGKNKKVNYLWWSNVWTKIDIAIHFASRLVRHGNIQSNVTGYV